MKRYLTVIMIALLMAACGKPDKQTQLRALLAERDALNARIEELKTEIAEGSGTARTGNLAPVDVRQIGPRMFRHFVKVQGMIESDNNILIPAMASGVVQKIHVTEGQRVTEGQLLAELDGAIMENTLAEVNINLELARTVYERQKRLWDKKIGSEVQFLQARTTLEALEKRKAAVEEQYRLTKISSPINGNVDEIVLKEGEAVAAGFGTIRVVELSRLKITAQLSEEYSGKIKVGDSVDVQVPLAGISFRTTVRSVARVIDPKNRTFPVEIRIPSQLKNIHPNMLAVLNINDYKNPNALVIPVNIGQRSENEWFVFVAKTQEDDPEESWSVQRKTITVGVSSNDQMEVLAGLTSGEFVVTRGYQDLTDGQAVIVRQRLAE